VFGNQYPDPRAGQLRAALGEFYGISPDNIFVTSGATGALELITTIFIDKGDECIYCQPTYMAYTRYITRNYGIPVELPLTPELAIDLPAMMAAITPKTKLMFICNPNNPTGVALPRDELKKFIEDVPPNIIIILDEAYIEFSDEGYEASLYKMVLDHPNLVVLRTFSKLYGLAGVRVGYSFGHDELMALLNKTATFFSTGRLGQAAAIAALKDQAFAQKTVDLIREGRAYLKKEFEAMGFKVYPSQTNFIYVDTGMNAFELAEKLKAYGLVIRGNFELSRITLGTMEQNKLLVDAIKKIKAEIGK